MSEERGGAQMKGQDAWDRKQAGCRDPRGGEHHVTLRESAGPRPDGRTENVYF